MIDALANCSRESDSLCPYLSSFLCREIVAALRIRVTSSASWWRSVSSVARRDVCVTLSVWTTAFSCQLQLKLPQIEVRAELRYSLFDTPESSVCLRHKAPAALRTVLLLARCWAQMAALGRISRFRKSWGTRSRRNVCFDTFRHSLSSLHVEVFLLCNKISQNRKTGH